jgi:hypothetical protein
MQVPGMPPAMKPGELYRRLGRIIETAITPSEPTPSHVGAGSTAAIYSSFTISHFGGIMGACPLSPAAALLIPARNAGISNAVTCARA